MATVLIASLGDSPVVVTAMFDLLRKEKNVDLLKVFYTISELPLEGYEKLIKKPLGSVCEGITLDADDVNSKEASYDFLRQLYQQLNKHQKNGDTVYLSLAGGRKSMASLMAFLTPFFSCVKGLYHLLDKDEGGKRDHLLSVRRLLVLPTEEDKHRHLFPSHDRVTLISIPYGEQQQLSTEVKSFLSSIIPSERIENLYEQDIEQAKNLMYYGSLGANDGRGGWMPVKLTKDAAKQYRKIRQSGGIHSKRFGICFYGMHFENIRIRNTHPDPHKYKGRTFHYYKRPRTDERPVFHIETIGTKSNLETQTKMVVVSSLPMEVEGRNPPYPRLEELVKKVTFPLKIEELEDVEEFEDASSQEDSEPQEAVLIIPLGISPMVATQLYQLYADSRKKVQSVVLVYTQHPDVLDSVKITNDAFKERGVPCNLIALEKTWQDIDTSEACEAYQELLEATIQDTRKYNPSCQIELTISGGRKGMAALATFAARKLGIRHVVHTVIYDTIIDDVDEKPFSERVYEETTVEKLKELERKGNKLERDRRLFLEKYKDDKDAFVLFNIPVLPV